MSILYRYGGEFISVELIPQDNDGISYPSGTGSIFVRLSFTGPVISPFSTTNIKAIENSIEMDLLKYTEVSRHTHQSAKTFLGRARQDFPFLDKREIKLFAEDETGQHRIVCAFVEAMTLEVPHLFCDGYQRGGDGTRHAALMQNDIDFNIFFTQKKTKKSQNSTWNCCDIRGKQYASEYFCSIFSVLALS
jgi:hypothetical protein